VLYGNSKWILSVRRREKRKRVQKRRRGKRRWIEKKEIEIGEREEGCDVSGEEGVERCYDVM
jgi:hypothetical protein